MQLLTIIYSLFCLTVLVYPSNYISELAISFLPYHIAILFVFLLINIYQSRRTVVSIAKYSKKRFFVITTIFCGVVFILYSNKFKSFYDGQNRKPEITSTNGPKILYANIHKNNTNYEEIQKTIEKTNPDLIMFVEFSENHYDHLKDFLKKNYPYINSTTRSKKFIWSMVFSKNPIINRADDFPQWSRRYGYFQTKHKEKNYYIYLIHTSSPDDYSHFIMRNEQLKTLWDDILEQQKHRESENIIIIGDFNLTPRSIYYKNFEEKYLSWTINQTKKIPFLFTWTFKEFPLLKSHIDQAWTSKNIEISKIETVNIPWSDHEWFIIDIK